MSYLRVVQVIGRTLSPHRLDCQVNIFAATFIESTLRCAQVRNDLLAILGPTIKVNDRPDCIGGYRPNCSIQDRFH
jgi:hypothetical protein